MRPCFPLLFLWLRTAAAQSGPIYAPTFDGCTLSVAASATGTVSCGGNGNTYTFTLSSTSRSVTCKLTPSVGPGSGGLYTGLSLQATGASGLNLVSGSCQLNGQSTLNLLHAGDLASAVLSTSSGGTNSININGATLKSGTNSVSITQANEPISVAMTSSCALLGGVAGLLCSQASFDLQVRLASTSPSAGSTRKKRDSVTRKLVQQLDAPDCPKGRTRCPIPGLADDRDSYECIDIMTELNSCGGCVTAGPGVDCETLPGAARGGVTCTAGRCYVAKCRRGWRSVNGTSCQRTEVLSR